MTTAHTLVEGIAQLRRTIDTTLTERNSHATALSELRGQQSAGVQISADTIEYHRSSKARLDGELDELKSILATRESEHDANQRSLALHDRLSGGKPAYDRVARVGMEKRTYRPDEDADGKGFLLDVSRGFLFQDPTAQERLARHAAEERVERAGYFERAVGTGAFAGLTVPQYLTDLYAPSVTAMRPFADSCTTKHKLPPDGMTLNISRITTGSSVAVQSSENSAVSETNIDDTLLTINVQTAAGQQTLSRQAVERGTGIEEATMGDLLRKYATAVDSQLINQVSVGLDAVCTTVVYDDASPTTLELWPKLFQAQNNVETTLLGQAPPTHFTMHPRRWNWICSQVSNAWPSVGGGAFPVQLFAQVLTNEYGAGVRAILPNGMKVVVDANLPTNLGGGTNQDAIYCTAQGECHLWEDPNAPVFIRAEQPSAGSLGVLLVAYGYFGATFSRYSSAFSKITGTAFAGAPTF